MWNDLYKIRYFAGVTLIAVILFLVAGIQGCRILGDDEIKPDSNTGTSRSHGGRSGFYHK